MMSTETKSMPAYQKVRRARMVMGQHSFLHHIPGTADGVEEFGFKAFVNFFAEALDINVHEVGAGIEIVVPDFFEDGHATADATGGAHEKFEQAVLAGGKLEQGASAMGLA